MGGESAGRVNGGAGDFTSRPTGLARMPDCAGAGERPADRRSVRSRRRVRMRTRRHATPHEDGSPRFDLPASRH
jgi:hypothetical protein